MAFKEILVKPAEVAAITDVSPDVMEGRYPLSTMQRDLYIGQQLDPASPLYNMGNEI